MNNFNEVFQSIKKNCNNEGEMSGGNCFEIIAGDTGIPANKIDFFLNILQELGLIRYAASGDHIKLTSFGKKQDRLFSNG